MNACDGQHKHRAGKRAGCRSHEIGVIGEAVACVRGFRFRHKGSHTDNRNADTRASTKAGVAPTVVSDVLFASRGVSSGPAGVGRPDPIAFDLSRHL
jgi:hypothetical protein